MCAQTRVQAKFRPRIHPSGLATSERRAQVLSIYTTEESSKIRETHKQKIKNYKRTIINCVLHFCSTRPAGGMTPLLRRGTSTKGEVRKLKIYSLAHFCVRGVLRRSLPQSIQNVNHRFPQLSSKFIQELNQSTTTLCRVRYRFGRIFGSHRRSCSIPPTLLPQKELDWTERNMREMFLGRHDRYWQRRSRERGKEVNAAR